MDADDALQGFFARLLEKNGLANARPELGRFRNYLLAAFEHYLANEWDRQKAAKRGGGRTALSLDPKMEDSLAAWGKRSHEDPEKTYRRQWASVLLDRVLARLRTEYASPTRAPLFAAIKGWLVGELEAPSHAAVAECLGMSEGAVRVAASRLRKRYGELLRQEIGQTVSSPGEVEDEIRELLAAFAK